MGSQQEGWGNGGWRRAGSDSEFRVQREPRERWGGKRGSLVTASGSGEKGTVKQDVLRRHITLLHWPVLLSVFYFSMCFSKAHFIALNTVSTNSFVIPSPRACWSPVTGLGPTYLIIPSLLKIYLICFCIKSIFFFISSPSHPSPTPVFPTSPQNL